jgi:amino acid adenylation domain-containing protein
LNAGNLLARLRSLGIGIAAVGERLRVTAERGALTDEIKGAIAEQKPELLDLLAHEAGSSLAVEPIPRNGRLPLSLFQHRLWVLHQLEPDSTAYNMATVWVVPGQPDPALVEAAVRSVVQNNEILRSVIRNDGGEPYACPLPAEAIGCAMLDLRDRSEDEQSELIRRDVSTATRTFFDLAVEAPVRWAIYLLSTGQVAVLLVAHHIALDHWSLVLLQRQIECACKPGVKAPISKTPLLQYADYAAWHNRVRNRAAFDADLGWWERHLSGIPQLCSFPADRTDVAHPSGHTISFVWDAELVAALRSLVRQHDATPYMLLVTLCAAVLHVHTGQSDIVLGSPMGIRERPEFETMIGPFVNLLLLRLDLEDDPTLAELLSRARDAVLDAHDHRQVPFELLVERLNPVRSFDRSPLFQVAIVLHNTSNDDVAPIYSGGAIHDLTWYAREVEGRMESSLEFRSDLYEAATVERIASHLEVALRALIANPACRLGELSLVTEDDYRLLDQFNDTTQELDRSCFAEQFERQAAADRERIAIGFAGTTMTYGALSSRSTQLAAQLRARGLGRGCLIGVCLERSPDVVVALLGVQKSGAAYVPLDPQFPAERLNFMMADSGMAALITSDGLVASLQPPAGVQVIYPTTEAGEEEPCGIAAGMISPDDIAYVIYTSGSTGQPNGVAVSHGALSNFLGAMKQTPGLAESDVIAAVTTISFDIAALELYLPLTIGARIELVPYETPFDGRALGRLLSECGATVLQATPAAWRLLVEVGWRAHGAFRGFCGGEALPADLARAILECVPELWNLYGPTEATVWSTAERVQPNAGTVSIGRPIANVSVYVLDRHRQQTAIGVPGEIWIGGSGVAAGYHRRPQLTADRFVEDKFCNVPNARMYRTGDLGRWGADGRLFHMGRIDRQVKLRGFRIEPEEIEEALRTHPAVRQAAVLARGTVPDQSMLVAYVVYSPGRDLTASEARSHLRRMLPEYMVPSVFVAVESLPLTPNGKVDAGSLPDPFKNAINMSRSHNPPMPGLEQTIATIWRDLLRIDYVGADDNFFELGGHSLLALKVAAAVEKQTGHSLPPRSLFFQSLRRVAMTLQREGQAQSR